MRLTPGQPPIDLNVLASILGDIRDLSSRQLLKLGELNIDLPRFSQTELSGASLESGVITQIVPTDSRSRRTSLNFSSGTASKILVLHGFPVEPTLEEMEASPWGLIPGATGTDDLDGGYSIWAMAVEGTAEVKIGLEYESGPDDQNTIITEMKITPLIGTGLNWDNSHDWSSGYETEINSSATGFKLFSIDEFTPGATYNFQLNPGSLNIDTSFANPVNLYLFHLDSVLKAIFWRLLNGTYSIDEIREKILPILKKKSWVASLSPGGGNFTLTPNHNRCVGLIDAKINGEQYAQTTVFNYFYNEIDRVGIFTLAGY